MKKSTPKQESKSERTPYSLVKLGKLYASAGRYDEAQKYYDEAIQMLPEEKGFYFYRGVAEFNMNLLQESLQDFETALSSDPLNKYEILNFTGALKYKLGDLDGALNDLEAFLNKNSGRINDLKLSMDEFNNLQKGA